MSAETINLIAILSVGFALAILIVYLMIRILERRIDETNRRIEFLEARVGRLETDVAEVKRSWPLG